MYKKKKNLIQLGILTATQEIRIVLVTFTKNENYCHFPPQLLTFIFLYANNILSLFLPYVENISGIAQGSNGKFSNWQRGKSKAVRVHTQVLLRCGHTHNALLDPVVAQQSFDIDF